VSYRVTGDRVGPAVTERQFRPDVSVDGAQPRHNSFTHSGYDRGHLIQREVVAGDRELEEIADQTTTVVPMTPALNRGPGSPWRAAEMRTLRLADEHGSVTVTVRPLYAERPQSLQDGTPVPYAIEREVRAGGRVLERETFRNR
jgi:endonuclease G, mitochondrial